MEAWVPVVLFVLEQQSAVDSLGLNDDPLTLSFDRARKSFWRVEGSRRIVSAVVWEFLGRLLNDG